MQAKALANEFREWTRMMFNPEKDEYHPQKVVVRPAEESGLGSLEKFLGDYGVEKIERARGGRSKRTFVVTLDNNPGDAVAQGTAQQPFLEGFQGVPVFIV